ncbi:hypothetical protein BpHYR1_027984 [Brachionus plicatilis]|uniref:Uncharacterized protein n=1 Tax=Brachionus plicatilis TaxID=10195 RepID=A0A3M7Q901_BRAPC|nr:hypothetical protein BpHYR1_027984 [Brachionus plicatilis]
MSIVEDVDIESLLNGKEAEKSGQQVVESVQAKKSRKRAAQKAKKRALKQQQQRGEEGARQEKDEVNNHDIKVNGSESADDCRSNQDPVLSEQLAELKRKHLNPVYEQGIEKAGHQKRTHWKIKKKFWVPEKCEKN